MKMKIIGVFVCMLLISTAIPVIGIESLQSEQDIALSTKCSPTTFQNLSIEITKPKAGKLYVFEKEIIPFPWTMIIGPITIELNATIDEGTFNRTELHVFNIFGKEVVNVTAIDDPEEPWPWPWPPEPPLLMKYTLEIIIFDNQENSANDTINFWKFF